MDLQEKREWTYEERQDVSRKLLAFRRQIGKVHDLRNTINAALSKVTAENLGQALTQKKNFKALRREYEKLTSLKDVLDPADAAVIYEQEYNYIVTIDNILTMTSELKKNPAIDEESILAMKSGLVQFYDGLRQEMQQVEAQEGSRKESSAEAPTARTVEKP